MSQIKAAYRRNKLTGEPERSLVKAAQANSKNVQSSSGNYQTVLHETTMVSRLMTVQKTTTGMRQRKSIGFANQKEQKEQCYGSIQKTTTTTERNTTKTSQTFIRLSKPFAHACECKPMTYKCESVKGASCRNTAITAEKPIRNKYNNESKQLEDERSWTAKNIRSTARNFYQMRQKKARQERLSKYIQNVAIGFLMNERKNLRAALPDENATETTYTVAKSMQAGQGTKRLQLTIDATNQSKCTLVLPEGKGKSTIIISRSRNHIEYCETSIDGATLPSPASKSMAFIELQTPADEFNQKEYGRKTIKCLEDVPDLVVKNPNKSKSLTSLQNHKQLNASKTTKITKSTSMTSLLKAQCSSSSIAMKTTACQCNSSQENLTEGAHCINKEIEKLTARSSNATEQENANILLQQFNTKLDMIEFVMQRVLKKLEADVEEMAVEGAMQKILQKLDSDSSKELPESDNKLPANIEEKRMQEKSVEYLTEREKLKQRFVASLIEKEDENLI